MFSRIRKSYYRRLYEKSVDRYFQSALAQQGSDLKECRRLVALARSNVRTLEDSSRKFRHLWQKIVDFYLSVFDVPEAVRIADIALARNLEGARQVMNDLARIREETSEYEREIGLARDSLMRAETDEKRENAELIVLISRLCVLRSHKIVSEVRSVYTEIFKALRRLDLDYSVSFWLLRHGTPIVPEGSRYISYHTVDERRRGLHLKKTERHGCFSFDRQGYSGWSEFSRQDLNEILSNSASMDEARKFFEEDRRAINERNISKHAQPERRPISEVSKPWIFVALQTLDYATQQLAHIPMLQMLDEISAHAAKCGVPVIVKRHPACESEEVTEALRLGAKSKSFVVSNASIHDLIEGSVAVCTVNSNVGAEALLYLKPVYLFGRSEYQAACFQITGPGEFARMFKSGVMPVEADRIKQFLYAYRKEYAVNIHGPNAGREIERRINQLIR
jgi:hypothetical protein